MKGSVNFYKYEKQHGRRWGSVYNVNEAKVLEDVVWGTQEVEASALMKDSMESNVCQWKGGKTPSMLRTWGKTESCRKVQIEIQSQKDLLEEFSLWLHLGLIDESQK